MRKKNQTQAHCFNGKSNQSCCIMQKVWINIIVLRTKQIFIFVAHSYVIWWVFDVPLISYWCVIGVFEMIYMIFFIQLNIEHPDLQSYRNIYFFHLCQWYIWSYEQHMFVSIHNSIVCNISQILTFSISMGAISF